MVGDGIECLSHGQFAVLWIRQQTIWGMDERQRNLLTRLQQHPDWQESKGWKLRLNNVQLLVQPFIFFCLTKPWLSLFEISA